MIENTTVRMTAGIMALIVIGTALARGTARTGPSDDVAAGGSPLYSRVVQESIRTLDVGELESKANVCPQCGQVHEPAAAAPAAAAPHSNAASARQPAVRTPQQTPVARAAQPQPIAGARRTALEEPPPDSYWCTRCRTYHPRRPTPDGKGGFLDPHTVPLKTPET